MRPGWDGCRDSANGLIGNNNNNNLQYIKPLARTGWLINV